MSRVGLLGTAVLLAVAGCSSKAPPKPDGVEVSGKVFLAGGAPLSGGTLVLRPVGGIHGASAPIRPDGSFALIDAEGSPAVVPGKYEVYVVFKNDEHKSLVPLVDVKYQNSEDGNSDLVVDIQEAKRDLIIRLNQ